MDNLYDITVMRSEEILLMSSDETVDLILWQFEEIESLKKRVIELEYLNKKPKKTSTNSSLPPSKGYKRDVLDNEKDLDNDLRHSNGGRELSKSPDEILDFKASKCLDCDNLELTSKLLTSYDKIFLPEVKTKTIRVNVYDCVCTKCNKVIKAEIPSTFSNRELLSDNLKAMIMYLHYENYVSFSRIEKYFKDIYDIEISQGLIDSVIKSSESVLLERTNEIKLSIQNSDLVCSDETSARVKGKTYWQWVFQNHDFSYHIISPTRGSVVKNELFVDKHPPKYVSDAFSSQLVGIKEWQVCLAHQIRDCNYLIDLDNNEFALKMKALFQDSIKEKDSEISLKKDKKLNFLSRLDTILEIRTESNSEEKLKKRFSKFRNNLFMFLDYDDVPPTNNSSEQALRPSVIFRKVTNGFRSEKGKNIFSYFRTVVDTAKKQGQNVFKSILDIFSYNKKNNLTI